MKINESLRHCTFVWIIRRRCEIIYTRLMSGQKDQRRMQAYHTQPMRMCAQKQKPKQWDAGVSRSLKWEYCAISFLTIVVHLHTASAAFKDNGIDRLLLNVRRSGRPVNLFACTSLISSIKNKNNLTSFEFRTSGSITKRGSQNRRQSYTLGALSAHSLTAFDLHQNNARKLSDFL